MTRLEAELRLSAIYIELMQMADVLDPKAEDVVRYAVRLLGLVKVARGVNERETTRPGLRLVR